MPNETFSQKIKQSWLYQNMAAVFGADLVLKETPPTAETEIAYFPVHSGMETIGWLGVPNRELHNQAAALMEVLVQHQQLLMHQPATEEEAYWKEFMHQDLARWRSTWDRLGYDPTTEFRHIYVQTAQHHSELDQELYVTLKEIVEGVLEQKNFLLPLSQHLFVWIIPDYAEHDEEWNRTLHGLLDTIVSECMIDVLFFVGESYYMPLDLQQHIRQETVWVHLAVQYGWDSQIIRFLDIIPFLLLDATPKQHLEQVVKHVLGETSEDTELLHTLSTFFKFNMNVSEAAKALYIHRNSMQYRLEKFMERTGLDVRQFEDAVKVHLALHILGMIHKK